MNARVILFIVVAAVILFVLLRPWHARAHDAPSGLSYPAGCCSNYDCRPVDGPNAVPHHDGNVRVRFTDAGGYEIETTGERLGPFGSDSRVKQSMDGEYHWCSTSGKDDGKTICLLVPPLGF